MSLFTLSLQVVGQDEMAVSDSSYDFIISDYFTNIKVLENGDLDVQEDIKVHFNQERHGIFRSIPFQYENLSGQLIAAPIEDVQVE